MSNAIEEVLRQATSVDGLDDPCPIVVIDDEPVILEIINAVFEEEPFVITTAATGEQGLERIEEIGPRVVLVDKNLPDFSGLEVIRRGKELVPDAEFLVITGFASLETAVEAMELGAFGYVAKPFADIDALRAQVAAAAEKNRAVILNRVLIDRLKGAYGDLFKAKVEIEMLAEVTRERLRLRNGELRSLLDEVLQPLAAVGKDLITLTEFVEAVAAGEDVRDGITAETGRLKMLVALIDTVRIRANELGASLADDEE